MKANLSEHYSFHKKVKDYKEHNGSERCDNEFVFLVLFHNLNPIYLTEFDLCCRHCESALTAPSTCLVARLLVMFCLSLGDASKALLCSKLARHKRGFELYTFNATCLCLVL